MLKAAPNALRDYNALILKISKKIKRFSLTCTIKFAAEVVAGTEPVFYFSERSLYHLKTKSDI
jgi:hypothetical protein